MEETLIIKNFGPIESVELKLRRFTILIGEQATGKSTIAKLLAVCRYFSYMVKTEIKSCNQFEIGLEEWGIPENFNRDTYISYQCEHYFLKVNQVFVHEHGYDHEKNYGYTVERFALKSTVESSSKDFQFLLDKLKQIRLEQTQPNHSEENRLKIPRWKAPISFFKEDVSKVIRNPLFLPSERSFVFFFKVEEFDNNIIPKAIVKQLVNIDEVLKSFTELILIQPLNIEYRNSRGQGYIRKYNPSGVFPIEKESNSFRSIIPIVLSVEYYNREKKSKTFIIEEPELNLFPIAQNELMKYLVKEAISHNHQVLLTTHSPYIISSLNNLLYAYQVGQKQNDQINQIIEEKYWINPNEVSAYRLFPNGTAKNILDDEIYQIDTGEIDEISRELNSIWDKISDVKYSNVEEA